MLDRSIVWTIYNTYTNKILTRASAPNGTMYKTYAQGERYLEVLKGERGRSLNWHIANGDDTTETQKGLWVLVEIDFKKGTNRVVIDCPNDWWVGRTYK